MLRQEHDHCYKKKDMETYDLACIEIGTIRLNKMTTGTMHRPPKQQATDDTALYEEIHAINQN